MKVVILFALFALCNCQYSGTVLESTPADSYGLPSEAPADSFGAPLSDSYGPPLKSSFAPLTKSEQTKEVSAAPATETLITEAVAAPAQSASFNLLTNLVPSQLLTASENTVRAAPVVQQEAPAFQGLQLSIPGLLPPITLPPVVPPAQVLPPAIFPPPQAPAPAPAPVPVPVPPFQVQPAQPIALAVNAVPATTTRLTTQLQEIPAPRLQTTFAPSQNLQYFFSPSAPFNYAPLFLRANTLPATVFATQQALPQFGVNTQIAEATNLKAEPLTTLFGANAFKAGQTFVELPATRYGTPAFDALKKK